MKKEVLLGDEAVALGAVHAGLSAAYGYPGTPASEIMEYLVRGAGAGGAYKAVWSVNEKTAYEEALGVSFAGKRALVSFKHVGLNVAADPFINSAVTGANGGLVVVSADDPGMHSSQNEQDSRFYADFARVLCFEPADQQEAYDMAREAFEVSEKFGLPVMIRLVTRLAHSRAVVETGGRRGQNDLKPGDWKDWTLLPVNARRRFDLLIKRQADLRAYSEGSRFNRLSPEGRGRVGVVAAGISYNYFREALADDEPPPFLKASVFPLPESLVLKLAEKVDSLLVLEDGYPLIEGRLRGVAGIPGKAVRGRLDGTLPASGELSPEVVRQALGLAGLEAKKTAGIPLAGRPPQLCAGCPHNDTVKALKEALQDLPGGNVFSDIGCYTLSALPPLSAIQTCVCMGASIGMARGAADAGVHPAVAVIGESTFAHSGITPLLSAAAADAPITVVILDNGTVAMTGGQPSYGTGPRLLEIVRGVGVPAEHLKVIRPLPKNHEANVRTIRDELRHRGISVIVSDRECVRYPRKKGAGK